MTFDGRRSTGSGRLGGEVTGSGSSGMNCGVNVSGGIFSDVSNKTLSAEECFEAA